ncbi:MAG TPA: polyprenyl synthetase family protein [Nitrososphaerales archaeon]|nr:polyprenyl synthetase family protein [Nitrososphaerales archaeon]
MELSDSEFASYFRSKTLNYHTRIEHSISDVLARFSESEFYEPLNYAMQGGKRIRPLIVLLCHDALRLRDTITEDPMPSAVSVELLHLESIIHDDIIDEDTVRRDRQVFHVKYGIATSILSADFVLGIILDIASQYSDSRIGRELSKAALRMSEGEFSEYSSLNSNLKLEVQDYLETISQKTASLFQTSAKLGAIVSGAKQQTIESMSDFGLNLGIAYQVQDDLLDWNQDGAQKNITGEDPTALRKMSQEFALTAKNALSHVPESDAKERLSELAEFAVRRRF